MKLLDRLVFKDLVPQLLIGIGMFTALYVALGPLLAAGRFLSRGVPPLFILKFILLNTTSILGQTFPMGMLLAVLLGFGRLSSDSETVALFAGGVPFLRIVAPAAALGAVVSGMGYIINDPVASYADHQLVEMRQQALNQQLDTDKPFDLPETRTDGVLQATVHIEKGFDLKTHVMRQVTITSYDPNGQPSAIFYAQSAHPLSRNLDDEEWQLVDVDVDTLGQNATFQHWPTLSSQKVGKTALSNVPDTLALYALLKDDPNALPFRQTQAAISEFIRSGLGHDANVRAVEVALWNKIALPLAALVFALVGAPLALRPQRSSKMTGWLLALPIILAYYVLYSVMDSAATGGACSPLLAAFVPDIVGLLVGAGLVWKQTTA